MELHHPTADSGLTLIETPGSKSFTRPKVIPSTVRDATYVLDEILDNETELPIEEHTTDTAGYTELIFALFDLLGMQFSPRIRDMADQQLYRADRHVRYEHIEPLLSGTINHDLILDSTRTADSVSLAYWRRAYNNDPSAAYGLWDGPGGITSSVAKSSAQNDAKITIGYLFGAAQPSLGANYTDIGGPTLSNTQTLYRPSLMGDVNLSGTVDGDDIDRDGRDPHNDNVNDDFQHNHLGW